MGQENTNKTLTMKDTNGKTITEEEFMKDIGHGVERTQENWKEELDDRFGDLGTNASLKLFISTLLAEERIKQHALGYKFGYEDGYSSQWKENYTKAFEQDIRNAVLEEVEKEVEKKLLEKARQTDYADRTEYDEASEIVSTIISNLRVK